MNREITLGQLMTSGYSADNLAWDGNRLRWGDAVLPMTLGNLDGCPPGVDEVQLLDPFMEEDQWLDGALITIPAGSATPVQYFDPEVVRTFVEQPTQGNGIWIGVSPNHESYMYIPATTSSLSTRKLGGSIVYGEGWIQCWVNMTRKPLRYAELCMDRFDKYDNPRVVKILSENEPVEAPMFWGLLRMLKQESA